jgi:hypothetical protein
MRLTAIAIGLCCLTLCSACGRSKAMPEIKGKLPVFPVQGKLTFNGEPAADVDLMFYPIEEFPKGSAKILPRARTAEDGSFGVSTYGVTDGAPVGKYRVTASWKSAGLGAVSQEQRDDSEEKLAPVFQNPRITRLRAKVEEGENNLPTWELSIPQQASASRG